jgi:putative membrane protein
MRWMGFPAVALAATLAIACDNGASRDMRGNDPTAGTAGEARTDVNRGDRDFVNDVAIASMAEIELGKMAAQRGTSPEVKRFGEMMVADHTKASEKLSAVATQHNISVPTQLDDKHRDLRDKLSKLQGAEFDREYANAMVQGHEDVVDKLESRIDSAKLGEWKSRMSDRKPGAKGDETARVDAVLPEKSDNAATMAVNQWAAEAYPTVHGHMERARTLESSLKGPRTTQ